VVRAAPKRETYSLDNTYVEGGSASRIVVQVKPLTFLSGYSAPNTSYHSKRFQPTFFSGIVPLLESVFLVKF